MLFVVQCSLFRASFLFNVRGNLFKVLWNRVSIVILWRRPNSNFDSKP